MKQRNYLYFLGRTPSPIKSERISEALHFSEWTLQGLFEAATQEASCFIHIKQRKSRWKICVFFYWKVWEQKAVESRLALSCSYLTEVAKGLFESVPAHKEQTSESLLQSIMAAICSLLWFCKGEFSCQRYDLKNVQNHISWKEHWIHDRQLENMKRLEMFPSNREACDNAKPETMSQLTDIFGKVQLRILCFSWLEVNYFCQKQSVAPENFWTWDDDSRIYWAQIVREKFRKHKLWFLCMESLITFAKITVHRGVNCALG